MSPRRTFAIFVLSVVTVAAVGVFGWRTLSRPEPPPWPSAIATVGVDPEDTRRPVNYLAVVNPGTQVVVEVPTDAVLEIPGTGFLRAFHAWRLGGPDLTRRTMGRLFGIDVPFSAAGSGSTLERVVGSVQQVQVPSVHAAAMREALASAPGWELIVLEGERKACEGAGQCVILDPDAVSAAARSIGGLGTRVFVDPTSDGALVQPSLTPDGRSPEPTPSPTPAATIPPREVTVEVLNGGRVDFAATRTANRLRESGYDVVRIGDHNPQERPTSYVYFTRDNEQAAAQVGAELDYPVQPIPEGFRTSARVLVVLGHDAQV